jgi:hypothetical protein
MMRIQELVLVPLMYTVCLIDALNAPAPHTGPLTAMLLVSQSY